MNTPYEMDTPRRSPREILVPGSLAGLGGGIAMGIVAMILAAGRGLEAFEPLRLISAVVLGEDATEAGLGAALLGLAIHLAVGAAIGIFFAWFLPEDILTGSGIAMGVLFGAIMYALMSLLVVPGLNPVMHEGLHHGWFFVEHLVYGLTLGLLIGPLRRSLATQATHARQAA